jgi:hypothetical protein
MTARAQPTTGRGSAEGGDGGRGVGPAVDSPGGPRRLARAAPGGSPSTALPSRRATVPPPRFRSPRGGLARSRFRFGLFVWCGLPVRGQSGGADHADLQYRRHEPPSQRDQQSSRPRCSRRGDSRSCRLAREPKPGGARQYHFVGAAALQPGAQSSGADLALSAQPLARQLRCCSGKSR